MKIGSVLVTFNPNLQKLEDNLVAVSKQVDRVLIIDNGSKNDEEIKELAGRLQRVDTVFLQENRGIAAAQNVGFEVLDKADFDWVVTLDQDTWLPDETIKKYFDSKLLELKDTAIVGGNFIDKAQTSGNRLEYQEKKPFQVTKMIASGNLVRVSSWKLVNGFDEKLFIDFVDYDFNARLQLAGFKIWIVPDVIFEHEIGTAIKKPYLKKILGFSADKKIMDHSPMRQFYLHRNMIVYWKRYPQFMTTRLPLFVRVFSLAWNTRVVFLYAPSKSKKMLAAWKGIFAGLLYKNYSK